MTRKIIIALMLLVVHLLPEAKQLKSFEGIDVLGTYTNGEQYYDIFKLQIEN